MPFGWLSYGFGGAQRKAAKPRGIGKRRAAAKRARRARRSGR